MTTRWRVDCWNCDEGFVEPVDEWDSDTCSICKGKGWLEVTRLPSLDRYQAQRHQAFSASLLATDRPKNRTAVETMSKQREGQGR